MRRGEVNKFNRGEIDTRALLREDVEKVNNSCELMENFMPLRLGPMQFRPGLLHVDTIAGPNYNIPFVARTDDTAIISFTASGVTIWVDDVLVDKPAGTMTLANQGFDTDLASWTDGSGTGSSAAWAAGGYANLIGADTTRAKLWQTFGGVGIGVEHSVIITVLEAPVIVKLGESGVDSDDIFSGTLEPGTHQLVFTPVAALPTLTLANDKRYRTLIDSVVIGDDSTLTLPVDTITELSSIRVVQSADVVFFATSNTAQYKLERRGIKSWSIVKYRVDDGPFGLINNTDITLKSTQLVGVTTLTASEALFKTTDIGRLYKLSSTSQRVSAVVSDDDSGTDSIRVTDVGPVRKFDVNITGGADATVTLQRSVDDLSWQDVETYAGNVSKVYNDDLDNSILHYRLHVEPGDYTSGTVTMTLTSESGSIDGICRVLKFTSATSVTIQILKAIGDLNETKDWYPSEWGADSKFPTAVSLYESRLWWAGLVKLWGSVSDQYAGFDDGVEGDSAPIRRTIGFGPVDRVDWLAPSSRLVMGVAGDEITVRSSSFGQVLSQSNCNLKGGSNQGVAPVAPVIIGEQLLFAQRSGTKLMDAGYVADNDSHITIDLCTLNPGICEAGIVRIAASMQPETRIYVVLADGGMRVHLKDPSEDVAAWSRITTDGLFKDVVVLPGDKEDVVYVTVERDGTLYLEKFSRLEDMVEQHYDAAVLYENPPSATLTGLDHLEGEAVLAWGDNQLVIGPVFGGYIVSGGSIELTSDGQSKVTVGKQYTADYKSNKPGGYIFRGNTMGTPKRLVDLHLAMQDYFPGAVITGPSFDQLEIMPQIESGTTVPANTMIDTYEERPFEFNGNDEMDPRICIRASGPCVILALTYGVLTDGDSPSKPS